MLDSIKKKSAPNPNRNNYPELIVIQEKVVGPLSIISRLPRKAQFMRLDQMLEKYDKELRKIYEQHIINIGKRAEIKDAWDAEKRVGLAMRRLSIVDVEGGRQPMLSRNGDLVIVFNGEIFNAPALRLSLEADGVCFQTNHSDTEVILKLYEVYGMDSVASLNGMFAFVIYDKKRKLLFGARDPFGIKPLHLMLHREGIAWASEIKSFLNNH